ncbi:glucosaminidase domain-containing protein [Thermovibrio sp.]
MRLKAILIIALVLVSFLGSTESECGSFKVYSHVNLSKLPVDERKKRFIEIMLPLIKRANREVLEERAFILRVSGKKEITLKEERKLKELYTKYRAKSLKDLLLKVNSVPAGLVLAQAAVESGWGTSRFFVSANNAFGIYTFKQKMCLKAKSSRACLKYYPNLYESVRDYIYNLNVGWAYERFRKLREKGADVYKLAESLNSYSTLGDRYVMLVKKVIRHNGLDSMGSTELASNLPSRR